MKWIRVMALVLLVALCAGCSGGGGFTWSNTAAQGAAAITPAPERQGSDTLRLTMPASGGAWDPAANTYSAMQDLMQMVYEPFMRLDSAQKPADSLAESWRSEDGGLTWEFTLRRGVYFHDGSGFTAMDCVKALDRIREVGEEGYYGWILGDIAGWGAIDENTLRITAARPGYGVLFAMVFPVFKQVADAYPVGTGPYRLQRYAPDEELVLTENQHWWRQSPQITSIRAVAKPSNEAELNTFMLGEFDLVRTYNITASLYRQAGVSVSQQFMTQNFDALFFNFRNPLMADLGVRQAVASAIDRQDLIQNILQGHAVTSEIPVPADSWLYDAGLEGQAFDAAGAYAKLEDMGFVDVDADGIFDIKPAQYRQAQETQEQAEGKQEDQGEQDALGTGQGGAIVGTTFIGDLTPLVLLTNYDQDNPVRRDAALRIAEQLRAAGLPVTVDAVPLSGIPARLEAGDYDMALLGYQIPSSCELSFLFSSRSESPQAGYLITRFEDERLDALLEAPLTARDDAAYKEAVGAVLRRALETLPCVGLYFRTGTVLTLRELKLPGVLREDKPYAQIESWMLEP